MRAKVVGFARRAAKEKRKKGILKMEEITITTKKGVYGRVNVTLPLPMKTSMLAWAKKSGMKKAEFLRMALTTGFLELSKGVLISNVDPCEARNSPPGHAEDGLLAQASTMETINE